VTALDGVGGAAGVAGPLVGSVLGGGAGFAAGVTLLPILVFVMGARAAIPVLTVTMLFGNLGRVWWSRHDVDPRVVITFLAGAVPATALGVMVVHDARRSGSSKGCSSSWACKRCSSRAKRRTP